MKHEREQVLHYGSWTYTSAYFLNPAAARARGISGRFISTVGGGTLGPLFFPLPCASPPLITEYKTGCLLVLVAPAPCCWGCSSSSLYKWATSAFFFRQNARHIPKTSLNNFCTRERVRHYLHLVHAAQAKQTYVDGE